MPKIPPKSAPRRFFGKEKCSRCQIRQTVYRKKRPSRKGQVAE